MLTTQLNAADNAKLNKLRHELPYHIGPIIRAARTLTKSLRTKHRNLTDTQLANTNALHYRLIAFRDWENAAGAQLLLDTHPDQLYLPLAQPDSPPCPEGDEAGSPDSPNTQTPQGDGP